MGATSSMDNYPRNVYRIVNPLGISMVFTKISSDVYGIEVQDNCKFISGWFIESFKLDSMLKKLRVLI